MGALSRTQTHAVVAARRDPWLRELDRHLHAGQRHQTWLGWSTPEGLMRARGLTRRQAKDALLSEDAERLSRFLCERLLQWVTAEHAASGASGASVFSDDQERLRAHLYAAATAGAYRHLWAYRGQHPSRSQHPIRHLYAAIDGVVALLLDPSQPGVKWMTRSERQRLRAHRSAEVRQPDATRVLPLAHLTTAGQAKALGVTRQTVSNWWQRLVQDGTITADDPRLPRVGRPAVHGMTSTITAMVSAEREPDAGAARSPEPRGSRGGDAVG